MSRPHPVLIDLAAGRPMAGIDDVDEFLRSAAEHRMHGLLWSAVERDEIALPRDAELLLAKWNLQIQARHRRLWSSLERAVLTLEGVGLGVAAAKGVTAEARWYPRMGTRPAVDVDLLLRPSDLPRANQAVALLEPNHQLVNSAALLARSGDLQSFDIKDDLGSDIDLHFDILKYEVGTRQGQLIWDRTQYFDTPSGGRVRVLDAETSLILFLLHLNKDRFSYLLGFADVVRLVDQEDLDWDFIDRFLRTEGLDTHLYLALDTVFESLGLPAPAHPIPSGWRAAAWRRLWPESVRLGGDLGLLSHHRRQYWIGVTARGRPAEATRRWIRRIFPGRALLDHYHSDVSGVYPIRLIQGRARRSMERRRLIRRLADDRPGSGRSARPGSETERPTGAPLGEQSAVAMRPGTGRFIVVAGPDGAGKTSLATAILARLDGRGRYFHFVPRPPQKLEASPPDDPVLVEKNREVGSRTLGLLRIGRNLVRAWVSYLLAIRPAARSGSVVVGDRWMYGYLAQPLALKFYGPEWVARLMLRWMPQPDLVVILQAPAEVIRERKPELSVAEIEAAREKWARIAGPILTLDATRPSEQLAGETLDHLARIVSFRRYPPTLGHVLLPARPRSAALAGSTLYSAARTRGLIGQRLGRGLLRAFGTAWLPVASPPNLFQRDHWEALVALLADGGLQPDGIALYTRIQQGRKGYAVLVIRDGRPIGFVRVGAPGELEPEWRALQLLDIMKPKTFRYPRLLGQTSLGDVDLILQTAVLDGYHRPPSRPPLDDIIAEIQSVLEELPKPPDTPSHWVPMHGDFTPWNLRQTGSRLSLIDWESAGWGPPCADQVLYTATSIALGRRPPPSGGSSEASAFWLERIDKAETSRDALLRRELLEALAHGGSGRAAYQ